MLKVNQDNLSREYAEELKSVLVVKPHSISSLSIQLLFND